MKYLVIHLDQTEQAKDKKILDDAGQAKEYIEDILKTRNIGEEQISIYELKPVEFQVDRIPVVRIADKIELPKMNIADIPDIITTEEEVEAEQGCVADVDAVDQFVEEQNSKEDNVEVFTFEN